MDIFTAILIAKIHSAQMKQVAEQKKYMAYQERQEKCLASVIYHEARGEPLQGQVEVAQVVENRSVMEYQSICKVVFKKNQFTDFYKIKYDIASKEVAHKFITGKIHPKFRSATYFHSDEVSPEWSNHFKRLGKIGHHTFYAGNY